MTARKEYVLEVFSDQNFVKDIVRGVLHTIFFHRIFSSIRPDLFIPTSAKSYTSSRPQESLSIQLPAILEPPEVSAAIDAHTNALVNQLTSSSSMNGGGPRGEIVVQLHDRQRTRSQGTGWLSRFNSATAEEEVCWEQWVLQVIVARPRTDAERFKVHKAMETSLQRAAMKIVAIVNRDKDHIPPIVTSDQNPFPYKILVNPREQQDPNRRISGWV